MVDSIGVFSCFAKPSDQASASGLQGAECLQFLETFGYNATIGWET